ncbi:MAG TPA: ShlB/FhaC/HecB family hemolysin secretion/activation protein [Gemmatimonadaceae bacterium]|nr:ShlB/FhaC/HecB family hemolysin secretion/activation protein [Gemmatimonadaceae bacterium]
MVVLLSVLLLVSVQTPQTPAKDSSSTDVARPDEEIRRLRRIGTPRVEVTSQHIASAYRDARARDVITRARSARLLQDSSLRSYEAVTRQRVSAFLGIRRLGRERLVMRTENAARVRWHREVGAWVDVIGARTAAPLAFSGARVVEEFLDASPIPYFPGKESLMRFAGMERVTQTDGALFLHPLERGSEAYYQFSSGDSISFRLPDGRTVQLVEVEVQARRPKWDVIVGSLWFDVASGQLVRGAFRPSEPINVFDLVEAEDDDDNGIPRAARALLSPAVLTFESFTVEYGLHEARWWMPSLQTAEGRMQMGAFKASVSVLESYRYEGVNGIDSLPAIALDDSIAQADSTDADTTSSDTTRDRRRRVTVCIGCDEDDDMRPIRCPRGDTLRRNTHRYDGTLRVAMRVPCDTAALTHSPELPPSIFDSGDELFGARQRDDLLEELSLGLQPALSLGGGQTRLYYGVERGLVRYNRVEGLSAGVEVERALGSGLVTNAVGRIGVADWEPNGELSLSRSNGRRTLRLGLFRRLAVANDWGEPLGLSASLSGLLFGRDEGFYYRSLGAELTGERVGPTLVSWRLFLERHDDAEVETHFSIPNVLHDLRFIDNIRAAEGDVAGFAVRVGHTFGLDPRSLRAIVDTRLEGGVGDFEYARGAADVTLSRGITRRVDAALTLSAGTSLGDVPVQRFWFLGGPHTVRGQDAGTAAGNAYWLGRIELGTSTLSLRPVIFADMGWSGDRSDWDVGVPLSGAGAGFSVLEGIVRFDLARGIRPNNGWRLDLYLDARF